MTTEGLTAPEGYLWCRGRGGTWHFLRAAELADRGRQGAPRPAVRSVCGLWTPLLPEENGWEEVAERVTPEPRRMCGACLLEVTEARRRGRLLTPPAVQGRLF